MFFFKPDVWLMGCSNAVSLPQKTKTPVLSFVNLRIPFPSCMQGTDDYLATGEELLIESARLVAKTGATLGAPA